MLLTLLASCALFTGQYPVAKTQRVIDDYHGTKVEDPYRWMESDSSELNLWIEKENTLTENYLSKVSGIDEMKKRMIELSNYEDLTQIKGVGGRRFYLKQARGAKQRTLNVDDRVLVDPNKLSDDGLISISEYSPSNDGRYVVYLLSESGSDWASLHLIDVRTKQEMITPIEWVKFSNLAWDHEGFYYSAYSKQEEKDKLSAELLNQKVMHFSLKTMKPSVVYEDSHQPKVTFTADVCSDYLVIYPRESAGFQNSVLIRKDGKFITLVPEGHSINRVIRIIGDSVYLLTNENAENSHLVTVSINNPEERRVVLKESERVIFDVCALRDHFFVVDSYDASMEGRIYDLQMNLIDQIQLDGYGQIHYAWSSEKSSFIFFEWSNFIEPPINYLYETGRGLQVIYKPSVVGYRPDQYEVVKEMAAVPYYVVKKKGERGGDALLTGYGGFGYIYPMRYRPFTAYHLENGGMAVFAILRGGGERGESWHRAGMKEKKQNVFDDFISVSEAIRDGRKLGIYGSSNGGLLVASVMLQRPELYDVVLANVGVHDMLRYQNFTIGWAWVGEYGSSEKADEFQYLYRYSPLHNVKEGVLYPATLITTGDHDDRVVPAHSYKFAATLQAKGKKQCPYLLSVEKDAGHGAGKPKDKQADFYTRQMAFFDNNTRSKNECSN